MSTPSIAVRTWVGDQFPNREIVITSEPEPVLLRHNLFCLTDDPEIARGVIVDWERILDADGAIGYAALGHGATSPEANEPVDREIARLTLARVVVGALPGAILFGILVAAVVWIVSGWSGGIVAGAFLGGLAFGFIPGAYMTYVRGTGLGPAYQDSFAVADEITTAIASIHADDEGPIEEAARTAREHEHIRLVWVDRDGSVRA